MRTRTQVHIRNTSDGIEIVRVVIPGDSLTPSGFDFNPAAGMFIDASDVVRLAGMSTVELVAV